MKLKSKINTLVLEGNFERALQILNKSLKRKPGLEKLLILKCRVLTAAGQIEAALNCLETNKPEAGFRLLKAKIELLISLGRIDQAKKLIRNSAIVQNSLSEIEKAQIRFTLLEAKENYCAAFKEARLINRKKPETFDTKEIKRLKNLADTRETQKDALISSLEESAVTEIYCNSAELAKTLLDKFNNRKEVFALQKKFQNGRFGYYPIYQPLTEEIVRQHLRGEKTIGIYLLNHDSMTRHLCIDIDLNLNPSIEDKDSINLAFNYRLKELKSIAEKIIKAFAEKGISLYPEKRG